MGYIGDHVSSMIHVGEKIRMNGEEFVVTDLWYDDPADPKTGILTTHLTTERIKSIIAILSDPSDPRGGK